MTRAAALVFGLLLDFLDFDLLDGNSVVVVVVIVIVIIVVVVVIMIIVLICIDVGRSSCFSIRRRTTLREYDHLLLPFFLGHEKPPKLP
jgi:hypothetical protein